MSEKIKAFIINRNLVSALDDTIHFLLKEPRVEPIVYDIDSSYPPLMEYYSHLEERGIKIIRTDRNLGPHSVWGLNEEFNDNHYIVADSDCFYCSMVEDDIRYKESVPDNWLDKMLEVLDNTDYDKVGFSLSLEKLPENEITKEVIQWEQKYWTNRNDYGWIADVDTTFSLNRKGTGFTYRAIRLDSPYTIIHAPWYITKENINGEWQYYLDHASGVSTWGTKLKKIINESK